MQLVGEHASFILCRFIGAESRKLNVGITLFTVTGICDIVKACSFYNCLLINYGAIIFFFSVALQPFGFCPLFSVS
jgi:hypothetical protein